MIVGIGTDIVQLQRIKRLWLRFGERFAKKILAPSELISLASKKDPVAFLAKRFAIKEAAAKALGLGFREGLSWSHISISHDAFGKPQLILSEHALHQAQQLGVNQQHITVSDEQEYAVAFVVLEKVG